MTETRGHPLGVVRIYIIRAHERAPHDGRWWRKMMRRDLAHQIVLWARAAGLPTAIAYRSRIGFVNHGPIFNDAVSEAPSARTMIVVEVAGDVAQLQSFVEQHSTALANALVHFTEVRDWSLSPSTSRQGAD